MDLPGPLLTRIPVHHDDSVAILVQVAASKRQCAFTMASACASEPTLEEPEVQVVKFTPATKEQVNRFFMPRSTAPCVHRVADDSARHNPSLLEACEIWHSTGMCTLDVSWPLFG